MGHTGELSLSAGDGHSPCINIAGTSDSASPAFPMRISGKHQLNVKVGFHL